MPQSYTGDWRGIRAHLASSERSTLEFRLQPAEQHEKRAASGVATYSAAALGRLKPELQRGALRPAGRLCLPCCPPGTAGGHPGHRKSSPFSLISVPFGAVPNGTKSRKLCLKCKFRANPDTHSDLYRTPIPIYTGHPFRFIPDTHSGRFGHPLRFIPDTHSVLYRTPVTIYTGRRDVSA
jgi:hypothetical protein